MTKARHDVVVHQPDGLHPRIDARRPDELERLALERCRYLGCERRLGRAVLLALPPVLDGPSTDEAPGPGGEIIPCLLQVEHRAGIVDRGVDLCPRADDPGVGQQARNVARAEAGHAFGSEACKGPAKALALSQDGEPRQARLESVEHEVLPERAGVVDGDAPLFVVVSDEERVVTDPTAAGPVRGHDTPK
jgi:hypothetical protein